MWRGGWCLNAVYLHQGHFIALESGGRPSLQCTKEILIVHHNRRQLFSSTFDYYQLSGGMLFQQMKRVVKIALIVITAIFHFARKALWFILSEWEYNSRRLAQYALFVILSIEAVGWRIYEAMKKFSKCCPLQKFTCYANVQSEEKNVFFLEVGSRQL